MAVMEWAGRVTVNWRAARIDLVEVEMALGCVKLFEALSDGAMIVTSSAPRAGVMP